MQNYIENAGGIIELNAGQPGLAHATRKVRRLAARGLIRRAQLKSGYIIQPRDDWPPANGELLACKGEDTK